ncbi:heavy-metal-associated domain-containing protein [Simplicispira psychrophila]|uniref:heavy-metal-associated domain-containing protein n=1 Tax=Simplicispira psychrophila TaxID=80882 RepID=UPI0004800467|nr:heavy-metal-associated domain-containing protein [Simplicispira psychrophila]
MKYKFTVPDMLCAHCEQSITDAIKRIDRQAVVEVDRPNDLVTVDSIEPRDALVIAITEEGYTVA